MKNLFDRYSVHCFAAALLLCACFSHAQAVSPFMGIGNAQFFDNNGEPLTAGVLYSYQAGTTTQQATYTDFTGFTQNVNPIPFSSGARVSIWLTSTASYKFVLCLQNDGAACAPADVLFSMDHVPGCLGCSTGGNAFTGTFISGTPNPASTGILELASIDSICWRNTAGNANLCISKDTSDVLTWTGGVIKLPEGSCTVTAAGQDYLCPNAATHHLSAANNNGAYGSIPVVPAAGASGHLAGFTSNGIDLLDSGGTPPAVATVTFSATPTFTATSQNQLFVLNLTGNVTSSTLVVGGLPNPSLISIELAQDASGGHTFVWPSNVVGAIAPATAANAITMQQFIWDGFNARAVTPAPPPPAIQSVSSSLLGGNVAVAANTATSWITRSVTMPSSGCPCRAFVSYSAYFSQTNAGADVAWVSDGSNIFDTTQTANTGSTANYGVSGASYSPVTYANLANVTFTGSFFTNSAGGATVMTNTVNTGVGGQQAAWMNVAIFTSN